MASDIRQDRPLTRPLTVWGGPAAPDCLLTSLRQTAAAQPDTVAVVDDGTEFTYAALHDWSLVIATLLTEHGVRAADRVAVTGPRSAAIVAAFLATVRTGATYVPLDPEYPARRLEHMLKDSGARILLHTGDRPGYDTAATTLRIPAPPSTPPRSADTVDQTPVACGPDLPVYVIYTSGTTGWPKGVAVPHSCLDNMAAWQWNHSVRPDLRTGQFAPLNFDVWFQEVLGVLCGGGTLVIMPERLRRDPFELLSWLHQHRIERLFLPYLALNMLSMAASAEGSLDHLSLVEINTAGEQVVCTPPIREFFARLPRCRFNNHYGQSESAMVTVHTLDGPSDTWPSLPPIGSPLPGCELLVDPLDPAEPEVGELLVAGLPVSLGYLNQPELNTRRYIAVPPTPQGHTRAFRTGDLVRLDEGIVHFLSRRDHDVKIRGTRVNLLEVDAWLLDQDHVAEAVCVAVEAAEGTRSLRAVVTAEDPAAPPDTRALLAGLATVLPPTSIPASLTVVAELPRTPSGKIDREQVHKQLAGTSADATHCPH
ncbi:AMP-binding protein [Streptomyces sp. NPDC102274]|uniref:AMP-binding protein n=1 Tax=Streptomyces sp. NPDC102274 TaxID=3366151 RepID=UPI00382D0D6C